jgi:hypothetical protein
METRLLVELDLFSGVPNPCWELSAEERGELRARLKHLRPAAPPGVGDVLGYRGFLVYAAGPGGARQPWLRVQARTIHVLAGQPAGTWHDVHGLETWLQDLTRNRGMELPPNAVQPQPRTKLR